MSSVPSGAIGPRDNNNNNDLLPSHSLVQPPNVEIDYQKFESEYLVHAISIDRTKVANATKILRGFTLEERGIQDVVLDETDPEKRKRLILLKRESFAAKAVADFLPEDVRKRLEDEVGISLVSFDGKNDEENEGVVKEHRITLDYKYHTAEYVLKQLLPDGMETPSAFEQVGHVAHVNLREEFLPYKYTIAKVIADKNLRIRTVVNKVGAIDSMFRVPNWELLYGDADLKATVKQHGYSFEVDFGKVYWNSRLETEHKRLVDVEFKRGEVIVDAMAGVGPFVVPAVKTKGCRVYASDLNPDCFEMMQKNVKLNKIEDSVKLYNMDARAFIKSLLEPAAGKSSDDAPEEMWARELSAYEQELKKFREKIKANEKGNEEDEKETEDNNTKKKSEKKRKRLEETSVPKPNWSTMTAREEAKNTSVPPSGATFDHIVMNLPATAVEFLDCLKHSFDRKTWENRKLPTVHAYAFRPPGHTDRDVISRAEGHLGCPIKNAKVFEVRDVAPNKAMVCVSFQITEEQAFGSSPS